MKLVSWILSCIVSALFSFPAVAAYPEKPVKFIVTFPAGGMTDLLARNLSTELQKRLEQPVIIDNRGGMGGSIGAQVGAKSPADGYTVVFANVGAMTLNTVLYKNLGYDALVDFVPVAPIAALPNVVAVSAESPYQTLADLVRDARANPGKMSYASTGTGASPWMGSELLKIMAKIDIVEVPYKGAAPALLDTIAGRTAFVFDGLASSLQQIKSGKIRALGISSAQRAAIAPDIPTVAEQGYPGFDVVAWYGLWAPSGTPKEIIQRLNREVNAILKTPEIKEKFENLGAEVMYGSADEFAAYHRSEYERWIKFVRASGIKQQ